MKFINVFVFPLLTLLMLNCKSKNEKIVLAETTQQNNEITFQVKTTEKDDLEIFEDGYIPWISIKNPEKDIPNLKGKDDVVVNHNEVTLLIDYPLNNPAYIRINSNQKDGFTRKELALIISSEYKKIYAEEEESAKIKTTPLEQREGIINRNQTNGKYGIWGHDIDDLDLSAVYITETDDGDIVLQLFVES